MKYGRKLMTDKYLEIAIIAPGKMGGRPKSGRPTEKWELMKKRGILRLTYGGLWKELKVTLG